MSAAAVEAPPRPVLTATSQVPAPGVTAAMTAVPAVGAVWMARTPAPGQHHRCHAVAGAQVKHAPAGHVAQLRQGRPDPRFVIEPGVVAEAQGGREDQDAGPLGGLEVVKGLLTPQAVYRAHGGIPPGGTDNSKPALGQQVAHRDAGDFCPVEDQGHRVRGAHTIDLCIRKHELGYREGGQTGKFRFLSFM